MSKPATRGVRRLGYAIAVVVNLAMLFLLHVWPGWSDIPFLTAETDSVLGLVDLSLVAGAFANLVYLVADPPRLKALGDLVTTGITIVVVLRVWQVFPFDFGDWSGWTVLARALLLVALIGSVIAMFAYPVRLVRGTRPG